MNCKEKETHIRRIQHALRVLNRNGEAVPEVFEDGIFGKETAKAVHAFQENHGLAVNETVDTETWETLMADSGHFEKANEPPLPILPFSDSAASTVPVHQSGEAVWFVQTMFHIIARSFSGFDDIPIDGKNEGATTEALCRVQKASDCPCKDGTLDKTTWNEVARLFSFCG